MQECLLFNKKKEMWLLDNGCSRHMIGDKRKFFNLKKRQNGEYVAFGDNRKAFIKGVGKLGKH